MNNSPIEHRCHRCTAEADAYFDHAAAFDRAGASDSADLAVAFGDLWDQIAELHTEGAGLRRDGEQ